MGKPRMIILIRHAQSEGNKNRDIHQTIPDHRVKLTPEGWSQAQVAGRRLRSMLRADDTLHFFTSPYRRTRETTEGILSTLTADDPDPSPFPRQSIKVYEEPRLREQDFGNFQPCSAEMERMWQERADYGHFFYRIPNGESAADAYDRISGFNESLWRQFGEDDCASVCVLVTHGLMSRVFLMKWYHFSVEYFEDLRNVNHCEFLIMRKKEDNGKYILENKLRTWSELHREREAERREKEKLGLGEKPVEDTQPPSIPKRKQWGGCPNGCEHGRHYKKKERENTMDAMRAHAKESHLGDSSLKNGRPAIRRWQSPSEDEDDPRGRPGPQADIQGSPDEPISSPNGTPTYLSAEDRSRSRHKSLNYVPLLQAGRDFGGSASGNTSRAGSDEEASMDEASSAAQAKAKWKTSLLGEPNGADFGGKGHKRAASGMGRGIKADALGDQSDGLGGEGQEEREELDGDDDSLREAEILDKSIQGSVY